MDKGKRINPIWCRKTEFELIKKEAVKELSLFAKLLTGKELTRKQKKVHFNTPYIHERALNMIRPIFGNIKDREVIFIE